MSNTVKVLVTAGVIATVLGCIIGADAVFGSFHECLTWYASCSTNVATNVLGGALWCLRVVFHLGAMFAAGCMTSGLGWSIYWKLTEQAQTRGQHIHALLHAKLPNDMPKKLRRKLRFCEEFEETSGAYTAARATIAIVALACFIGFNVLLTTYHPLNICASNKSFYLFPMVLGCVAVVTPYTICVRVLSNKLIAKALKLREGLFQEALELDPLGLWCLGSYTHEHAHKLNAHTWSLDATLAAAKSLVSTLHTSDSVTVRAGVSSEAFRTVSCGDPAFSISIADDLRRDINVILQPQTWLVYVSIIGTPETKSVTLYRISRCASLRSVIKHVFATSELWRTQAAMEETAREC